jgi:hypothetical protein
MHRRAFGLFEAVSTDAACNSRHSNAKKSAYRLYLKDHNQSDFARCLWVEDPQPPYAA